LFLAGICLVPLSGYCGSVGDSPDPAATTLESITVMPPAVSIAVGATQQFTAIGAYSDGHRRDITSSVAWSSSATNIVTITSAGLASGVIGGVPQGGSGHSTITATLGSVNGSTGLTVTDYLTSIAITPSSVALQLYAQQAFTATGTYQDGLTADVTSSVNWTSGNRCVVTLASLNGTETASAAGLGTVPVIAAEAAGSGSNIVGTATVTVGTPPPPAGAIPASFFGMTIGDNGLDSPTPYSYPPTSQENWPSEWVPIGAIGHPTELAWAAIETSQGSYDFSLYDDFAVWSAQYGVPFMVTFGWTPYWAVSPQWQQSEDCHDMKWCSAPPQNNSDWTNFVAEVVSHYSPANGLPAIQYYEVWNEANDPNMWAGSQEGLAQLANLAYQIIHPTGALLGAPSVTDAVSEPGTSSGGMGAAEWLAQYLQTKVETKNGVETPAYQFADGGSFHGYLAPTGFSPYPFPEDCSASGYDDIVTRALMFRNVLDTNGLAGKRMYDSEGSWGKANITDSAQQAAWLARWYLLQAGSQVVQSAYWFPWGLSNPGQLGQPYPQWGLITDDCLVNYMCNPTAAGIAYGQVYDWLVGATISPCSSAVDTSNLENYIWTCNVVGPAGQQELALWYYSPDEADTTLYTPGSQFTHYLDLAGGINTWKRGSSITITAEPVLLTP